MHTHSLTHSLTRQYSGGQATEGQGGFYGSGGARGETAAERGDGTDARSQVLALAADVQTITAAMDEYTTLASLLDSETNELSNKAIELKAAIKKCMTASDVTAALNRLQVQGEPVWGLSTEERELIITAREIVQDC